MSRKIYDDVFVSATGEVLVENDTAAKSLKFLTFEKVDDHYVKIVGLPPIKQARYNFEPLIMLTLDGRILVVSPGYPTGFEVKLDVSPIKLIDYTAPLIVLDYNNTVHLIDISTVVEEQARGTIDMKKWTHYRRVDDMERHRKMNIKVPFIENVRDIGYHDDLGYMHYTVSFLVGDTIMRGNVMYTAMGDDDTLPAKNVDRMIANYLIRKDVIETYHASMWSDSHRNKSFPIDFPLKM